MLPEATIAVVIDDQDTRTALASDLAQRYAVHYRIVELESATVGEALADIPVLAAVITTVELDGGRHWGRAPVRGAPYPSRHPPGAAGGPRAVGQSSRTTGNGAR